MSDLPSLSAQDERTYLEAHRHLKSRYLLVVPPLFVACIGEAIFSGSLARTHPDAWLGWSAFVSIMIPWLVMFVLTFVRVPPPISPRVFRRAVLVAVYCYATTLFVFAAWAVLGSISFSGDPVFVPVLAWSCSLCGAFAVPTLLRCAAALKCVGNGPRR